MGSVLVETFGHFKNGFGTVTYDLLLLAVSFPALLLLTVWDIHFAAEENKMTLSLGMKLFPVLLLPEAVLSIQLLPKFRNF